MGTEPRANTEAVIQSGEVSPKKDAKSLSWCGFSAPNSLLIVLLLVFLRAYLQAGVGFKKVHLRRNLRKQQCGGSDWGEVKQ